ncbi:MAG: hypothetical protein J1E85_02280 [Ruminococcus sp.]|nr:hypothetical protein [Ruminococcus sp.]
MKNNECNNKEYKLYNVIFPIFMLFIFNPFLLIFSLCGNFIIDSIVLLIISFLFYKKLSLQFYISNIFKVWLFGFFSDFVGLFYLIMVSLLSNASYYDGDDLGKQILSGVYSATNQSHFDSFWGFAFIMSGIIISAAIIFLMNYIFTFNKLDISKKQKLFSALILAVSTAPYTFLLPKELFY